jgi:hypothetical protein
VETGDSLGKQLSKSFALPKAFAFTILGLAAGGGAFSFKNGATRFGSPHTGYPLIFPCNTESSQNIGIKHQLNELENGSGATCLIFF